MAQQNNNDQGIPNEVLYPLFACLILFVFWKMFRVPIVHAYMFFLGIEAWIISLFTDYLEEYRAWSGTVNRSTVSFEQLRGWNQMVGSYTRFIWIPVMLYLAFKLFMKNPAEAFNKMHTPKSLVKATEELYPHASIFFSIDLSKVDNPGEGSGPGLKPREFLSKHDLIDENNKIKRELAEGVFITQLGPVFSSVQKWKNNPSQHYKLALATLFFLGFYKKRNEYIELRNLLAKTYNKNRSINDAMPLVMKYWPGLQQCLYVQTLAKRHSYEYTFLTEMYTRAKRSVTPSLDFRWVKQYNRTLWYTLNQVGRRVAWAEAAAIRSHYFSEIAMKKGIRSPKFDELYYGFDSALKEIIPKGNDDIDSVYDEAFKNENNI